MVPGATRTGEVRMGGTTPASRLDSGPLSGVAARGAALTGGFQGMRLLLQIVGLVVLARFLSPDDYGLVAMVVVLVGLGEIVRDFGLSSAAVQAPELTRAQRDNLFWLNGAIGLALAILAVAGSGLVAALYAEPRLVGITQALGLVFVLNGLSTQYRASLQRDLKFGLLAGSEVLAQLIGLLVGIGCAIGGLGYWALVAQSLAQAAAALVLLVAFSRWLPSWYDRTESVRPFASFGWHLAASQVVGYLGNNVDTFVVGRQFGAAPLGIYSRGYQLVTAPLGRIRTPATTVALPVLSKIQRDQPRFDRYLRHGLIMLGYTIVPALAIIMGAAEPVVRVALGETWMEVVPYARLFALAGTLTTLSYVGYWAYLARGLTKRLLHYTFVSVAIKVTLVLIGSQWGPLGVAVGFTVAPAVSWPLSLWWLSRRTPIPLATLMLTALRVLTVALSAAGATWYLLTAVTMTTLVSLVAAPATAALVYGLAAILLPPVRSDVRAVFQTARAAIGSRRGRQAEV
jgi:O-antigen/teichoic acid export membrane protein